MTALRELSLFTGAGGGVLGSHLLGWMPVGYVEWDKYCQRVLKARIADGLLPNAPIFGDIRAFNRDGYARAYQGLVDVVTAGFPCQPFSVAGKQLGADDPRNMWPATAECLGIIRPPYALLENVAGLINSGYLPTILGDLAELGYDVRWGVISASDAIWHNSYPGAPAFEHERRRLWTLCHHADGNRSTFATRDDGRYECVQDNWAAIWSIACPSSAPADSDCQWQPQPQGPERDQWGRIIHGDSEAGADTADPDGDGLHDANQPSSVQTELAAAMCSSKDVTDFADPSEQGLEGNKPEICEREHQRLPTECGWWSTEPAVGRVAHGVASGMVQLEGDES